MNKRIDSSGKAHKMKCSGMLAMVFYFAGINVYAADVIQCPDPSSGEIEAVLQMHPASEAASFWQNIVHNVSPKNSSIWQDLYETKEMVCAYPTGNKKVYDGIALEVTPTQWKQLENGEWQCQGSQAAPCRFNYAFATQVIIPTGDDEVNCVPKDYENKTVTLGDVDKASKVVCTQGNGQVVTYTGHYIRLINTDKWANDSCNGTMKEPCMFKYAQ